MFKLGRHARAFDPRILHYSALAMKRLSPPPAAVDYSKGMPAQLGMMLNDELGDCTCADVGHSVQVWSFNAHGKMQTPTDQEILKLYEGACGYNPNAGPPGLNPTDQGGNMQNVRNYIQRHGIPLPGGGTTKVLLWVEVDPRNHQDIMRVIDECGGVSIGFNVPQYLLPQDGSPPPRNWLLQPAMDNSIIGGHDVFCVGYDHNFIKLASWGQWYEMAWAFWDHFVEEAYGTSCEMWVKSTGKTPAGLTEAQLAVLMKAMAS